MKYLIPFFLFLFLSAPVYAAPTMEVTWIYPVEAEVDTSHFQLFLDDVPSCISVGASERTFTCTTEMENRDYSVTLRAIGKDGVPDSGPSNVVVVNPPDKYFIDLDEPVLIEIKFIITDSNVTVNISQ